MKIIYNKYITFKGFYAINLFGTYFIREEYKGESVPESTLNHEAIHTAQMKEMGYIFFYVWYFIEWLIRLVINGAYAYYKLSFEQEAYNNENNYNYLKSRKPYSWFEYYGKRK
ncbi:hypothetical protein [Fusobacterium ulcerans]|uniref:hypothetical protein n=1 Tax=Fusobacterium ulcerans TaxID=861 RepID=UPI002E77E626|nr:hypothetical protein [Fusobacterium ulcerans]MEE0138664.1 hypothetical protein [Fusobacterium ulcerans]